MTATSSQADSTAPTASIGSTVAGETPATTMQTLYGTTPIYMSGGYPIVVPGVLPYTGYEAGVAWAPSVGTPTASGLLPYQATAPRTLAGETDGRRIVD